MPTKKKAAKKKPAAKPAPKTNPFSRIHQLVYGANTSMGVVTEVLAHIQNKPHKDLEEVKNIIHAPGSHGETVDNLKVYLKGKV